MGRRCKSGKARTLNVPRALTDRSETCLPTRLVTRGKGKAMRSGRNPSLLGSRKKYKQVVGPERLATLIVLPQLNQESKEESQEQPARALNSARHS